MPDEIYNLIDDPVMHPDSGNIHNFTVRLSGEPYRCSCGCNVFHKPDKKYLNVFRCNGCVYTFSTVPGTTE